MKYILVTGAYGGMGRKMVETLAAKGYGVIAMDRQIDEGEPLANVHPIQVDLTDAGQLALARETVCGLTERLYAIVHFAGIYLLDSLVEISDEAFEKIYQINVFAAWRVNKLFLPMLEPGGRILITTSELASLDPLPFTGLYAVTKAALDRYAYSLRMELQLLGIHVSVLRTGAVNTGMLDVSMQALERFCENTQLYACNAKRFRAIVEAVEARHISPEKVAKKALSILVKKRPRFAFSINRNPLLLLMALLPKRLQLFAIRLVLK